MPHIDFRLDKIPLQTPFRLEHEGTAIVVIRSGVGLTAFLDCCPHAQWPLSEGEVIDGILRCAGHGWQFSLSTGQCLNAPAYRIKLLSVVISGDTVRIEWDRLTPELETRTNEYD